MICRRKVFQPDIPALDELNQRRMPQRCLLTRPSAKRWIAHNLPWPDDSYAVRVNRINQRDMSLYPAPLPAYLRDRIIIEVRCAQQSCALLQPQHNVAPQSQRPGQIVPCRHQNLTPAKYTAAIDRLLERNSVVGFAVTCSPVVANIEDDLRGIGKRLLLPAALAAALLLR